jgi:hypothetical protein
MPLINYNNKIIVSGAPIPMTSNYNLAWTSFNSAQVILTWQDIFTNEDGYKIERSDDGVTYSQIGTVGASVLTYTDSHAVSIDSTYYYRIRGYKGATDAGYSNVATVVYNFTGWYGVEWDITTSDPLLTRIASDMTLHASLPVQSEMKGCVLAENGTVAYYLDPTDWTKKVNGDASVLDGTDGHVMVEMPAYYVSFETSGNTQRVKISLGVNPGWTLIPACYMGAYEAALNWSTLKLASVINSGTTYRGGNNTAAWDGTYRTLLGKPATNISRTDFRTCARNIGTSQWNVNPYFTHKSMFWLYMVEYANRNCQSAVTGDTIQGYHQGGLGLGVTTLDTGQWNTYNSYNPVIPCGASNSLGNFSGEVSYGIPSYPSAGSTTYVKVPRYRGIENPFGHIWKWSDGVNFDVNVSTSSLYATNNPNYFTNSIVNMTNYGSIARVSAYVKQLLFGTNGDILPIVGGTTAGGSVITFWCDYYYCTTATNVYALVLGGLASTGSGAGLRSCYVYRGATTAGSDVGARLCFLP